VDVLERPPLEADELFDEWPPNAAAVAAEKAAVSAMEIATVIRVILETSRRPVLRARFACRGSSGPLPKVPSVPRLIRSCLFSCRQEKFVPAAQ
jgi:hypothetical protein